MTVRYSSGLRSFLAKHGSMARAFHNAKIKLYTGGQPSSADAAPTGTLLCTITDNSSAHTAEVLSAGTVTLTGGASGSVDQISVNSVNLLDAAVAFNTSLTQTASDVADAINAAQSSIDYWARSSGAVITIYALPGLGTTPNGYVVSTTVTTITKTDVNMGTATAGVAGANGVKWGKPTAGVISKKTGQTLTGVNATGGVVGWFRLEAAEADSGAADSAERYLRLDGSVGTASADMTLSNTTLAAAATTTIPDGSITIPASA